MLSETDDQSNFNYAPASTSADPAFAARTKDFYLSLRFSVDAQFNGGASTLLPVTITSPCLMGGTAYFLDQFTNSTFTYAEADVASTGSITVNVEVTPNPYPAGMYINAVLSH